MASACSVGKVPGKDLEGKQGVDQGSPARWDVEAKVFVKEEAELGS